jgi:hypothetical protein
LSRDETSAYLAYRCTLAGCHVLPFDRGAIDALFEMTCGNLRALVVVLKTGALPTARVADLDQVDGPAPWLVRSLWIEQAVGFVAGTPRAERPGWGSTWPSPSPAPPCLDRFEVDQPGLSLIYLAEDSLQQVRRGGAADAGANSQSLESQEVRSREPSTKGP